MVELIYKCNKCGKNIPVNRTGSVPEWTGIVGYGSKYDGEDLDVHFCPECFDAVASELRKTFAIDIFPHSMTVDD